jgi:hypothetical protein
VGGYATANDCAAAGNGALVGAARRLVIKITRIKARKNEAFMDFLLEFRWSDQNL